MIAWLSAAAWGATCCGAGPPVDPGALGAEERAGLAVGLQASAAPARWSSGGQLRAGAAGELGMAVGARLRAARWLQGGLSLPVAASVDSQGSRFGPGDALALLRLETRAVVTGRPRPALIVGGTAPVGRETTWWRVLAAPALELSNERLQGSVAGSVSLPVWAAGQPLVRPGADWELSASAGPRAEQGSLSLGVGLRGTTPGAVSGELAGMGSFSPVLRGAGQLALPWSSRLVLTAQGAPPVPLLGRNADATLALAASVMRVW